MLLRKHFENSPAVARVAPFLVFLLLTFCQGQFGEDGRYWFYLLKTLVGAWLIWEMQTFVTEMRWKISWAAVAAGVGVFVIWVGLDPFYAKLSELGVMIGLGKAEASVPWNPLDRYGGGSALAWILVATRIAGSTLIVAPLEEVFFRSWIYRYIVKSDFQSVPLSRFVPIPFVLTAVFFAFEHEQWLAGLLCAFAYHGLVLHKQRLGDAITAHAITNFLLGIWVVWRNAWNFW